MLKKAWLQKSAFQLIHVIMTSAGLKMVQPVKSVEGTEDIDVLMF